MVDEGMAEDAPPGPPEPASPTDPEEILYEARVELDSTSDELEQLTAELAERTELAARLELITDALLEVMSSAAIVIDADHRVVAVSRSAAELYPELTGGLGQSVQVALPRSLTPALAAFYKQRDEGDSQPQEDGPVRNVIALSDGSVMLVLRVK